MANLHKFSNKSFQCESIEELMDFNQGITQLFAALTATENFTPDFYIQDDWKAFNRVLKVQEDAQNELRKRIVSLISHNELEQRNDILD